MKILITGASGQLGHALREQLESKHELLATDIEDLDIRDLAQVREVMGEYKPDSVIHLAAMTQVDICETQPDRAYDINALGTRYVALAAAEVGAELIYISTDYVFDGQGTRPYQPYDNRSPLNVYGWSKLGGERVIETLLPRHYILRTSGLFGLGGSSFVSAIESIYRRDGAVKVVADQSCRPTYAGHLARAISRIVGSGNFGAYHVASTGETSWFEFARAIVEAFGGDAEAVAPLSSAEFVRPATRPAYSVLNTRSFEQTFGYMLPHWREGLEHYFGQRGE